MNKFFIASLVLGLISCIIADDDIYGKGGFFSGLDEVLSSSINEKERKCKDTIDAYEIWEKRHGFKKINYKNISLLSHRISKKLTRRLAM